MRKCSQRAVAQVSKPAVSPISQSADAGKFPRRYNFAGSAGLETRDTAGLETCATYQRGVALVVTLLMLSVITVTAVAFLALSRRERISVTQTVDIADARFMADIGLERAKGQFTAPIIATTNMQAGGLIVSRSYINPAGFQAGVSSPFNVSYVYPTGQPLNPNDFLQNITNLLLDPRVPVYVRTNSPGQPPASEFRFYLDLNRNGIYDTNGFFFPVDDLGQRVGTNTLFFVGDPEWIGVLEKPNLPHAANNRFIGRYAYIVVPIGKALDLNYIHNQSQPPALGGVPFPGRFYRNQGFGTYEINLAAFLTALNTNIYAWADYYYQGLAGCTGNAFLDALDLVRYRYQGNYLDTVGALFGPNAPIFSGDMIDGLAHDETLSRDDLPAGFWPGANSRQHFYTIHELFDRNKVPSYSNFVDRLNYVSSRVNSYDRYTFYRLLAQLGTDSAEEPQHADIPRLIQQISAQKPEEYLADTIGRINLNYDNINYVASDFTNWHPLIFFTNVGNILMREQFPFPMTSIPVSPTNWYVSSLHRLLQVTANIHDATTTDWFPTIFLPQFTQLSSSGSTSPPVAFVSGYITNLNRGTALQWASTNIYGVPAVVGAKKGLPNFNEHVFQTSFQITRKLELSKPATNAPPNQTNQIMLLSISNLFAAEIWNSYSNAFSNDFRVFVSNNFSALLVNAADGSSTPFNASSVSDYPIFFRTGTNKNWHFQPNRPSIGGYAGGFMVPLYTNLVILTNSRYTGKGFDNATNSYLPRTGQLPVADWRLIVSNRLTYVASSLSPATPGKVLDLVSLAYQTNINLTEILTEPNTDFTEPPVIADLWNTNRVSATATLSTPTEGILRQLQISLGYEPLSDADWRAYNFESNDRVNSINSFKGFVSNTGVTNQNLYQQAPFTATRKFVHTVTWQANDPLVHYMSEDLKDRTNNAVVRFLKPNDVFTNNLNLGQLNDRYRPWLGHPLKTPGTDRNESYVGVKDPGVLYSDNWDFPSQKFPSIGWLGRVHRGTPWQTVYLKAEVAPPLSWQRVSLDPRTHPTNDWRLLDMFTVAQTPNASHGQLSINQDGLAAWAAVLGGVTVLSNTLPPLPEGTLVVPPSMGNFTNLIIDAKSTAALQFILDGINATRQVLPNQVFRSLGEILSVPELTTRSPYINTAEIPGLFTADTIQQYGFNDEAYERIPRQILSLLKVGDARYVVYAFGQSLKPADRSIVVAGNPAYFGVCTNYQITGEVFTRSVVKLEGTARNPKPVVLNFNILPAD